MIEQDEDRLNFYSKYTRAKENQGIDSLYTLISGAKSSGSLQIHIMRHSDQKERLSRKASASPQPKRMKSSVKAFQLFNDQSEDIERKNMEEINEKLQQLKKMEKQFHEQMERRQIQMQKRRASRDQHKKDKIKYKQSLINVVQPSPNRRQSHESLRRKMSRDPQAPNVEAVELDFQDYYRESPEVVINTQYEPSPETKRQLKQMIEMQKNRSKEVMSVDEEENGKANSIVIERIDISTGKSLAKKPVQRNDSKNLYQLELARSRSEDTLAQNRFGREENSPMEEPQIKPETIQVKRQEQQPQYAPQEQQLQYSPARNVRFESQTQEIHPPPSPALIPIKSEQARPWGLVQSSQTVKQVESIQFISDNLEQRHQVEVTRQRKQSKVQIQKDSSSSYSSKENEEKEQIDSPQHYLQVKPRTGTEGGSSFRDQMADQVEPIAHKSSQLPKLQLHTASLYHSQASPTSKLRIRKEVKSNYTDSFDDLLDNPSSELSDKQRLQNKKSSFKKLMAQNRANLVPRMAISTILNQKINEALGNHPVPPQASPTLQQSIINSEVSSPTKRKVNFKRRIVEAQLDKTNGSKPSFERDPVRARKNQNLLAGFFADN